MSTTTRTPTQAIAFARDESKGPTRNWNNLCLQFVRTCYRVPPREPNARLGWANAKKRHKTSNAASIPAGVPVWWNTKTTNDHVAISAGNGMCYSTDVPRGKVGLIGINDLSKRWGATLLGWSEDINGVRVYTPPAKPKPPAKKSVAQLAAEVIAGKWGNGATRKKRLTAAGHNYAKVQAEVNRRLKK